jgi:scyllo-inositol 2-dehydrogenase (NADP+)
MTRVALLGYGLAGRVLHRPLVQAVPELALTHVVTSDPVRAAQARADLPGAALLASADELWARTQEYDVVVVATGNTAHVPQARAALDLGKVTVVDKPLALTAEDATALVAHAHALDVPLTVFQNRRWDSDTLTAQALLAQRALGPVIRLESRFTRFRPQVVRRWREDAAQGGGVLLDLGAHLVDQALLLLGPATSVYAEVDTRRDGATADDDCFLALTHRDGARSHLWVSMAAPHAGPRIVLQGTEAGWSKQDLDGQEDALRAGTEAPPEPDGVLWDTEGCRPHPSAGGDWPAFYRGVAATARTGAPVPVDPGDSVRVLTVLDAARESARRHEVVAL